MPFGFMLFKIQKEDILSAFSSKTVIKAAETCQNVIQLVSDDQQKYTSHSRESIKNMTNQMKKSFYFFCETASFQTKKIIFLRIKLKI